MNEQALMMLNTAFLKSLGTVIMDKMGLLMVYRRAESNEQGALCLPAVSWLLTNVASLTTTVQHCLGIENLG